MRRRTPPQKRISESLKRFNIGIWGRQSGKTTFGIDKCLVKPLQSRPNGVYWYVLQNYAAATVAFRRYINMIYGTSLIHQYNKSERSVHLMNGSTIFFKSGKNFEDLRSETLDGAVIDELRQQHSDLWPMIIRPMLTKRNGWCDFLSTTNGFDHTKDLYDFALEHPDEWATFHAPSTEAPWWTSEEIASAKSTMTEDVFAQEIEAEFREISTGKAYIKHGQHNQKTQNPFVVKGYEWSPFLPIIVGMDFNVGICVWELGQMKGRQFYWGDEIALENTDTQEMAIMLSKKVIDHKPGVILIGDASGNARKTSSVGETDYKIIKKVLMSAGIRFQDLTPSDNPPVKDRVNSVNSLLQAADGSVNCWYHPTRCKRLKKDFERVKWKSGAAGAFLDKSDITLTHASDAAGYPMAYYSEILKERPSKMKVIQNG